MKKNYLLTLIFFSFGTMLTGQTFVCSPSNSINGTAPLNAYTNFNIDMVNQTSDTMTLAWNLIANTLDESWDYSLCDYTACYTTLPASSVMSPNYSGNSFLKLTLNPMNIQAAGELKFWVYDFDNPTFGDTVTFSVSSQTIGLEESLEPYVHLYPNPANDYINIGENVSALEIFDLSGTLIFTEQVQSKNDMVSLSRLNAGYYIIKLTLTDGSTRLEKIIVEH